MNVENKLKPHNDVNHGNELNQGQRHDLKSERDPDEINLLEYLYALLKFKWVLLTIAILGYVTGHLVANYKGAVYIGDVVISPKEAEAQSAQSISGFGMFNNVIASQLNMGGNASLAKIELTLDSRSFHAELIEKKKLIPLVYADYWDSTNKKWLDGFTVPPAISVGGHVKGFLKKEVNKNGTMTIKIETKDSLYSYKLLTAYLEYLDEYIKKQVQEEAKENKDYLDRQLLGIVDPLLQAKIQDLISKEVEKMMVVSKEAFKIIDPVLVNKSFKEKRLYPLIYSFGGVGFLALCLIIGHAVLRGQKTGDDKELIARIRKEFFKIPFVNR